jgi:ABC-type transport system involved in cytochrome c biogenesis permease subunit
MFVIGDSDFVSDAAIRVAGNGLLALDTVRWLAGDEAYSGQTNVETDVPITHTRKQDIVWFYSSIFLMPVVVLALGFLVTRRRRTQKKAAPVVSSSSNQGVAS